MLVTREKRVYLIRCGLTGLVKIGSTVDVQARLDNMQTGTPGELSILVDLPGDGRLEADLHRRFGDQRVRGEWFRLSDEDVDLVRSGRLPSIARGRRRAPRPDEGWEVYSPETLEKITAAVGSQKRGA